ncbi:MAG: hydrogenase maturation nickel metallochaperone HypA [Candidatus Aminicenantes bacterium]|nr:hydrogenase maturation nickel metallochaperone HypA [Candidatus Aminicenantes bacterium]
MHELSIVANLFDIMEEQVREQKAKKITGVKLQVGRLSGVVPEFLETAFHMYKKGTIASEARLEIENINLTYRCCSCGKTMIKDDYILICDACGSTDLEMLAGTELLLERMEMEV